MRVSLPRDIEQTVQLSNLKYQKGHQRSQTHPAIPCKISSVGILTSGPLLLDIVMIVIAGPSWAILLGFSLIQARYPQGWREINRTAIL